MLIRPSMVKNVRGFLFHMDGGFFCPSEIVYDLLTRYKVNRKEGHSYRELFERPEITKIIFEDLRKKLVIDDSKLCCSVCLEFPMRKYHSAVIEALPDVLKENAAVYLVVAG